MMTAGPPLGQSSPGEPQATSRFMEILAPPCPQAVRRDADFLCKPRHLVACPLALPRRRVGLLRLLGQNPQGPHHPALRQVVGRPQMRISRMHRYDLNGRHLHRPSPNPKEPSRLSLAAAGAPPAHAGAGYGSRCGPEAADTRSRAPTPRPRRPQPPRPPGSPCRRLPPRRCTGQFRGPLRDRLPPSRTREADERRKGRRP